MDTAQLILYRNFENQQLLDQTAQLLWGTREGRDVLDPYILANRLIELAANYGFEGNLWLFALPTTKMPTAFPVRSAAIRGAPCPGLRNRTWL